LEVHSKSTCGSSGRGAQNPNDWVRFHDLQAPQEAPGIGPDDCYWIANASAIRGRLDIDLRVDPPPDLAIEIDVTSSSLDRMEIYRALAVTEVWRFDGETLTFFQLQSNGKYAAVPTSLAFPGLEAAELVQFLALAGTQDDQEILQAFRAWVRQRFGSTTRST
jgi:Uma2 family endonuclease